MQGSEAQGLSTAAALPPPSFSPSPPPAQQLHMVSALIIAPKGGKSALPLCSYHDAIAPLLLPLS